MHRLQDDFVGRRGYKPAGCPGRNENTHFFNRKQEETMLTPADMIEGVDSEHSNEVRNLDSEYLPSRDWSDSSSNNSYSSSDDNDPSYLITRDGSRSNIE